jgi:hypothetical protein
VGLSFLAAGVFSTGFMSAARISIDQLIGPESVAVYAAMFRILSIAVPIYQFFMLLWFRPLLGASSNVFDHRIGSTAFVLTAFTAVVLLVAPHIFPYIGEVGRIASEGGSINGVAPIIGVQVVIWICSSALEFQFSKHHLGRPLAIAFFVGVAIFAGAILLVGAKGTLDLRSIVLIHALCHTIILLLQLHFLRRHFAGRFGRFEFLATTGVLLLSLRAVIQ